MNSPITYNSLDLRQSDYRMLPGIVNGGGIKMVSASDLKQPTPEEKRLFPFLTKKQIERFIPLAEEYGISEKARGLKKPTTSDYGFLTVFNEVGAKGLERVPAKISVPHGISMAKKRIVALKGKVGQMKSMGIPLYREDGKPTKMHTILIMWGYSPDAKKL